MAQEDRPNDSGNEEAQPESKPANRLRWALAGLLGGLGLLAVLLFFWPEAPPRAGPDAGPPPSTGSGHLDLVVVDEDGAPLAAATLTVRMRLARGGTTVCEATTDDAGRARVEGLPDGEAEVFAIRSEGAYARGYVLARIVNGEGDAEVVLEPGQQLLGRVLDDVGAPVADAIIEARAVRDDTLPEWTTRSDAEGNFTLDGLLLGPQRLLVQKDGYDEISRRVVPREDEERIRIVLARTGLIVGRVVGPDGAAAPGTEVVLAGSGVWPPRSAETDSDGLYRFEGVPEGIYELRARRGVEVAAPREGVILDAGGRLEIGLDLEQGRIVTGVVLSAEDDAPVSGADVVIGEEALSFVPRATTTTDDGTFSFDGLRAIAHRLAVYAEGYVSAVSVMTEPDAEPLRLILEREAIVSGVVVDALGHPVEGAEVELVGTSQSGSPVAITAGDAAFSRALVRAQATGPQPVEESGELGVTLGAVPPLPVSAVGHAVAPEPAALTDPTTPVLDEALAGFVTDAEGRFRIAGVSAGRYQVVGRHPSHAPGIGDPFTIEAGETREDLELVLPAGAAIDGRVVDGRGFPVDAVRVEMHCEREPFARWALSEGDGTFAFEGALGRCVFSAHPAGLPAAQKTLDIAAGAEVSVELALTSEIATLTARVVDEAGFPVAGARIAVRSLRADAPARRTTWSGDDGTVEVPGMPPPPWRAEIDQEGYAVEVVRRITDADREHRFTLHAAASVVGRVLDGWSGEPVGLADVRLTRVRGAPFETASDETGTFELSRVAAGNYELIVEAEGLVPYRAPATLRADRTGLLDLDLGDISLEAGGGIRGEVVDALGAFVIGAEVAVGDPPRWDEAARTDGEGGFTVLGVAPGEHPVTARHPGAGTSEPAVVRVRPRDESMGTVLRLPERFDPERAAAEGTGRRRTGVAIGLATRGGRTRIASVRPDSQAAIAGLRVGDVVETIDGEPAGDAAEAEALLRGPVGTEVLIEVRRAGRTEIIPVDREAYRAP